MTHHIRPDGQKATPEEIERARAWNPASRDRAKSAAATAAASTSAAAKSYKTPELVPSDADYSLDADTCQVQSKVELAPPPQRKKRPRKDHAGRERTSQRRTIAPEEKKTKVSPDKPPQAPAPPCHQHPLSYKGRSCLADKGKERAAKPAALGAPPREPEASASSQDDMAPKEETKVKSSSRAAKKSNSSTSLREKKSPTEAKESSRPVAAVVPNSQTDKTQVESDLAISSSDTDAEPQRTVEPPTESDWEEWTDVEPEDHNDETVIAVELSSRPQLEARPPPVYTQADSPIEIEDEPATQQPIPTLLPTSETIATAPIAVTTAPLDTIAAPAPATSTAPTRAPTGDPTVRRVTRPSHPYVPLLRKLRATPPIPQPIIRTPTEIQDARRRTRICSVNHVAVKTVDFSKTTEQLTHELTQTHALNSTEQQQYLKEMRLMRVGQKVLVRKIRLGCGLKCRTHDDQCCYLDWMEDEFLALLAHASDSDEQ